MRLTVVFAIARRSFVLGALATMATDAPLAGQRPSWEVRAGVVASTPLVEDLVASGAQPYRAAVGPSPILSVVFLQPLRSGGYFDASLGWTFGTLRADDADGEWRDVQDVNVPHATLGYRYDFPDIWHIGAGLGALSYRTNGAGIFQGEPGMRPFLHGFGGGTFEIGAMRVVAAGFTHAHKFGSTAVRAHRGVDGTVLRYGVQLGLVFGGERL